jgi:hypothetical protein
MQGGGKGTRTERGAKDGKGKRKGKGQGNRKGTGIVTQTPGGQDISGAVALQSQKQLTVADLIMEGYPEWVYVESK